MSARRAEDGLKSVVSSRVATAATPSACAGLIGFVSFLQALASKPTANVWPAQDMFPFFMIKSGEATLASDFVAQCSILPNPRHIFGDAILGLSSVVGGGWYDAFFLVYAIVAVAAPAAMFIALNEIACLFLSGTRARLAAAGVLTILTVALLLAPDLGRFFAIAWWTPLTPQATPHGLSLLLAAASAPFAMRPGLKSHAGAALLLGLATLIHPTVGFSFACVYALALLCAGRLVLAVRAIAWSLAGVLGVVLVSHGQGNLSAREFVDIYAIGRHPWHYTLSGLEPLFVPDFLRVIFGKVWYVALLASLLFIVLAGVASFFARARMALLMCSGMALFLVGALAAQYVAVEVIPIKAIAVLGPSRFLLWNYWFAALAIALAAGVLLDRSSKNAGAVADSSEAGSSVLRALSPGLRLAPAGSAIVVLATFVAMMTLGYRDQITSVPMARNGDLLQWISQNTEENAVFVVPQLGSLDVDIPLATHRSIFSGSAFPFTEICFREYDERRILSAGTSAEAAAANGSWAGGRLQAVYDGRTLDYFDAITRRYRADYVVVRNEAADKLDTKRQVFRGQQFSVFRLRTAS